MASRCTRASSCLNGRLLVLPPSREPQHAPPGRRRRYRSPDSACCNWDKLRTRAHRSGVPRSAEPRVRMDNPMPRCFRCVLPDASSRRAGGARSRVGLPFDPRGYHPPRVQTSRRALDEAVRGSFSEHFVGNKVEAAYARSDLFERRQRLMDDWAGYLAGKHRPHRPIAESAEHDPREAQHRDHDRTRPCLPRSITPTPQTRQARMNAEILRPDVTPFASGTSTRRTRSHTFAFTAPRLRAGRHRATAAAGRGDGRGGLRRTR